MSKVRQQYVADNVTLKKDKKEFAITPELIEKLDSIEAGAQVNVIETVKVNGEALTPDEDKAVDIDVPLVEDSLYSTSSEDALSAKQGRILYDYITAISSRGRYLSNWNCVTGLPTTSPVDNPYQYMPGDYYVVTVVAQEGGTNYKPNGSEYYHGVASATVEIEEVQVGDFYNFDGTNWLLQLNTKRDIPVDSALSNSSTNPVENRVVTGALNTKQNNITDLQTIREGAAAGATALQPGDSLSQLTGTSDDIAQGTTNLFMTTTERGKLANQTGVNTGDETVATIKNKLGSASATTDGYLTSTDWNTFNDKQDAISDLSTIRSNATAGANASATIATYGDIVTHNVSEFASISDMAQAQADISSLQSDRTTMQSNIVDLQEDMSTAQYYIETNTSDIAGLDGRVSNLESEMSQGESDISDIKGDITQIQTDLASKQDKLIAGTNIQIASDGKTISATDTKYTAGPGIAISNNNVISNTQTSAEWGNIQGDITDQTDLQTVLSDKQDKLTAGDNITINSECVDRSDMQGPCPDGFHVPLSSEWDAVYLAYQSIFGITPNAANAGRYLKMPKAGYRLSTSSETGYVNSSGNYRSSTRINNKSALGLYFENITMGSGIYNYTSQGLSIRAFKNEPVIPDDSWDILYGTSVDTGGIFWNQSEGLITIKYRYGQNTQWLYITLQDKNLGATVVYNRGDTITDDNSGYFYQWGNNKAFPHSGSVANTSTTVDASTYGPGNYYEGELFITTQYDSWDTTYNYNLWGGVSQGSSQGCFTTISATDTTYTAGTGIDITNGVISNTQTSAEWGNIEGNIADQTDLKNALDAKQDDLIAGTNIQIASDGRTISATDTTYSTMTTQEINTGTGTEGRLVSPLLLKTVVETASNNKVSDLTYSSAWDGVTGIAPSKNAMYDKLNSMDTTIGNKANTSDVLTKTNTTAFTPTGDYQPATKKYVDDIATDVNTKTFYLSGSSDLTTAQAILDWYNAGKNPIISYNDRIYTVQSKNPVLMQFYAKSGSKDDSSNGYTNYGHDFILFELSGDTVNTITINYITGASYLRTDVNYSTPYTPTYNGSPATKKYVDDTVNTAAGGVVSDIAYASNWNGVGTIAPSKNAVYDKIESVVSSIPTQTSQLTNNSGFITNAVNDLTNYYTKSETYTKAEVGDLIANFAGFKVVATLPTSNIKTNIIYLLGPVGSGADRYEEYIYSNNAWIKIGETSVDLTNYFNTSTQTSDAITQGSTNLFLTSAERTKLSNTSGTNSGDETKSTIKTKLGAASASADGYLTSTDWSTFNSKQSALATQTAYTNKGSASKVPQITTNSLGQVTSITEVDVKDTTYDTMSATELNTGTATTGRLVSAALLATAIGGKVSDTAYASSWDGVTTTAPSKNAVYDKISAMDTTISGKQAALTTAQLNAVNSGITSTKVSTYDGYATTIGNKADTSSVLTKTNTTSFTPTADYHPATKKYVDDTAAGKVSDTAYASSWNGVTTIAPSKNAVYDKIAAMDTTISGKADSSSLATVATSGSYNDLSNKPTIPTKTSQLTNDSGFVTNQVNDTAYASSWDGVTTVAPSKNAVYDKINRMESDYAWNIKKVNTYEREYSYAIWSRYGTPGLQDSYTITGSDNSHIKIGDRVMINGVISDKYDGNGNKVPMFILGTCTNINSTTIYLTIIGWYSGMADGGGSTTSTATLSATGWNSSNQQTITVSGVTASNTVIISPAPANIGEYTGAGIYCSAQGSNSLTFTCASLPDDNISINVVILS